MTPYRWKRIQDLPADWERLCQSDVAALSDIWKEQHERLSQPDSLREFNERLRREWAIETGIIENLYSIDRGTTELLIEQGFDAALIPNMNYQPSPEEIVDILHDHQDTLEGLFDFVASRRPLSISYVKELHQALTRHQETSDARDPFGNRMRVPLHRGAWKEQPNNPTLRDGNIHEYCPPEHVAAEMDRLMAMHLEHVERQVPPEVEAAWLHHRFTEIHPFQDGNGRVARALASLIFMRAGWFPLVIRRELRREYLDALETADDGNLKTLIELFSNIQKDAFIRAMILADPLGRDVSHEDIIAAAREKMESRNKASDPNIQQAVEISHELERITERRLQEVGRRLTDAFAEVSPLNVAVVRESEIYKIVLPESETLYHMDLRAYQAGFRFYINERDDNRYGAKLFFVFCSLGRVPIGIMGAFAFIDLEDFSARFPSYPISDKIFQFSYNEQPASVIARFVPWLESAITVGLDYWRRQL